MAKKPSFGPDFSPFDPNSGCQFFVIIFFLFLFFSKIWLRQYLDVMVGYHYLQYQKKLMIQSRENSVMDGQTDRPTDRLTDGQE